jgi:hypothetical protein
MATRKPKGMMQEIGYAGQNLTAGVSTAEMNRELNYPQNLKTFKLMSMHPSINTALSLYNTMVSKARLRVVPVKDASKKEVKQAEILQTMLTDMQSGSVEDLLLNIMTMSQYGFSVLEKVYYLRKKENGSAYNDGLIGVKKLALRAQPSITKFMFDPTGNEVIGVEQDVSLLNDTGNRFAVRPSMRVVLPREKFMLFNVGRDIDNPFGTSPLRDVYLPWKYLTSIEELEAAGVAKDLQGLPVNV